MTFYTRKTAIRSAATAVFDRLLLSILIRWLHRALFVSVLGILTGCVQITLDDLGTSSRAIPAKLMLDMQKKGMSAEAPVLVRIFKMESELEVWKVDKSGRYALLRTYPICRWSGKLGPKTKSGDRQAPEGFYRVSLGSLNPNSQFFLSFNLGYPNRLEAALGYSGEALMVHGACSSSGCFALTDQGVGEIYALMQAALKAGQPAVQVQSFPFRMTPENLASHRDDPNLSFWFDLKRGYDIFDATRREPKVSMCNMKYVFDIDFAGHEPANPLAACPAGVERPDPEVVARGKRDKNAYDRLTKLPVQALSYGDGGMHPSFRALLRKFGETKLAERVSGIKYPISRPEAALADPYLK